MKAAAILPVLTLLAGTVYAQTPEAKPGSIEGVVSNSATGEPVKKAVVTLQGDGPQKAADFSPPTAITDVAGHFHFDSVAPGSYRVTAQRDGYMADHRARFPFAMVTVGGEQHVQDVAIKLLPLGVASGHVLDEDGDPMVRAQISVLQYSYGSGRKRLNQIAFVSTNDLGEFEALNLAPGRYYFQASTPPRRNIPSRTHWAHAEEAYPVIFYPNAREIGQATATDVAAGAHVGNIDFRLRKMPAYHIRGTVIGASGLKSGNPGEVFVGASESAFGGNFAQSNVQPDGSFDVQGAVNGSYEVGYRDFGNGKAIQLYSSQSVRVADADVNAVVLSRKPEVDVSGTVSIEGQRPDNFNVRVHLSNPMGGGVNGLVAADGSFTITAAPAAVSQFQISNIPFGKYVKSIRFGDREIKNGEIDLSNGASGLLTIVLGADGGEVDGNVQTADGKPNSGAQITLAPAEEFEGRTDLLKRTLTDPSGNFRIKDVAPGEYKIFAWENDQDGNSMSAEFRKPFESRSVAVTVGPKDRASVQLTVISEDDIEKERSKLP